MPQRLLYPFTFSIVCSCWRLTVWRICRQTWSFSTCIAVVLKEVFMSILFSFEVLRKHQTHWKTENSSDWQNVCLVDTVLSTENVTLTVCLPVYLSIYVCLSVCLSFWLSVCLSIAAVICVSLISVECNEALRSPWCLQTHKSECDWTLNQLIRPNSWWDGSWRGFSTLHTSQEGFFLPQSPFLLHISLWTQRSWVFWLAEHSFWQHILTHVLKKYFVVQWVHSVQFSTLKVGLFRQGQQCRSLEQLWNIWKEKVSNSHLPSGLAKCFLSGLKPQMFWA